MEAPVSDPVYVQVLADQELVEGRMRCVEVDGRQVLLVRTRDGVHALDNICTHAYARMDEGRQRGHRLICPLHGASFDARTGAVLGAPASKPLATHAVRIEDGMIAVALSAAEEST
jgi:nitrite reductase/ring-hydroxylating ferredoxin subunit